MESEQEQKSEDMPTNDVNAPSKLEPTLEKSKKKLWISIAIATLLLVGGAAWAFTAQGSDDTSNSSDDSSLQIEQAEEPPTDSPDTEDQVSEPAKQDEPEAMTISEGWVLNETQFGDLYLPETEGKLVLEKAYIETDKDNNAVNHGFRAETTSYDFYFYDIVEHPIITHSTDGRYNPCTFNTELGNFEGTEAVNPSGPYPNITTDEDCMKEGLSIGDRDFLDFSVPSTTWYKADYLTISVDQSYLISIAKKAFVNPDCLNEEGAYIGNCDTLSEEVVSTGLKEHMEELREFIEEFIRNNEGV